MLWFINNNNNKSTNNTNTENTFCCAMRDESKMHEHLSRRKSFGRSTAWRLWPRTIMKKI